MLVSSRNRRRRGKISSSDVARHVFFRGEAIVLRRHANLLPTIVTETAQILDRG